MILSTKDWRVVLFVSEGKVRGQANNGPTYNAQRRVELRAWLEKLLREDGLEMPSVDADKYSWKGVEYNDGEMPEASVCREIIWDLNEINFRYELVALAQEAGQRLGLDRMRELAMRCFPPAANGEALIVDANADAERGLASSQWQVRHPYVMHLRRMLLELEPENQGTCSFDKTSVSSDVSKCKKADFEDLEDALARYYCRMFFKFFGRPATIPRHLRPPVFQA